MVKNNLTKLKSKFWTEDLNILYKNYHDFVPVYNSTREEQLNAIVRFCIYFIIINIFLKQNEKLLYLPIITITMTTLFYYLDKVDKNRGKKRVRQILNIRENNLKNSDNTESEENNFITNDEELQEKNLIEEEEEEEEEEREREEEESVKIETGFYDSSGKMLLGQEYKTVENVAEESNMKLYTDEEIIKFKKNTCKPPTKDNPFMNPSITDYGDNMNHPEACNAEDTDINNEINLNFNKDLFRNIEDMWNVKNSQRQFYTIPSAQIPNNQIEFAKALYLNPSTCKTDQSKCLRYEDIKFKR
jgi:hypothetical protein